MMVSLLVTRLQWVNFTNALLATALYDHIDSIICVNIRFNSDDTIAILTIMIYIITYLITYQKQL